MDCADGTFAFTVTILGARPQTQSDAVKFCRNMVGYGRIWPDIGSDVAEYDTAECGRWAPDGAGGADIVGSKV